MKQLAALGFLFATSTALAQCDYTNLGYSGSTRMRWCDGHVMPDGSMLAAIVSSNPSGYGGFLAVRLDPAGDIVQSNFLHTVDPTVRLYPTTVLPTPSGGMLIIGHRIHPRMENYFALELNAAGDLVWAKILMEPTSAWSDDLAWNLDVRPLPGGGYVSLFPNGNGIHRVELDANGTPVAHKRYAHPSTSSYSSYSSTAQLIEDDGTALYSGNYMGYDTLPNDTTTLIHADVNGDLDWSMVVDTGSFVPASIVHTGDGGYLIAGGIGEPMWTGEIPHAALLKVDASGQALWKKSYGDVGPIADVAELASGDLLVTFGRRWGYLMTTNDTLAWMRTNSTGDVQEAMNWTEGQPVSDWYFWAGLYGMVDGGTELVGLRGDSVILATTVNSTVSESWYPGMTIATDVASLSCGMTTVPVTATVEPVMTSAPFTCLVDSDTARVWEMAMGPLVPVNELDVVSFVSAGPARPGFNVRYDICANNWGGITTGPISTTFNYDPLLTYVGAYPPPTSMVGSTMSWSDTTTLGQFEDLCHTVFLNVPVGTLNGTLLYATVSHSQASPEVTLANNSASCQRTVSSSFDPNDKLVWPRDFYHLENDSILDYTIQFQNTGTDTAFTVVVVDTLPLDVDVTTIRFGAASHPYTYDLSGNGILTFTFNHILLPDSNTNEPASHGLVNFRIKPILPLALGQEIINAADIYFDFNDPIHTPDATVVVTDQTGVRPLVKPAQLVVYPVPTKNTLTAMLPEGFKPVQAFAIGTDGRRLPMFLSPNATGQVQFGTQHMPPGAYVLTLRSQDGKRMSARFTKE